MNILVIGSDRTLFEEGAPVRKRLCEQAELVNRMEVIVFTPRKKKFTATVLSPKLIIHPTYSSSRWTYLWDAYRLARTIISESGNNNWVISTQDPFEAGVLGYLIARVFQLPLHLQLHTDPFCPEWRREHLLNRLRYAIATFLLRHANGVRVVSRRLERGVHALGVPLERITRIPIFTDVERFILGTPSFDLKRSYPAAGHIILSLGRLTHEKYYTGLLRAFAEVLQTAKDTLLLIVGDGPERGRLIALARSLGIEKHFRILPWARDTVSYYKGADLYVQPSLYEGWGLAVVEAMASRAAIVMTDTGCAGEIVRHGETGLIVPPADTRALAAAITQLLHDETLRHTLASAAQTEVRKLPSKTETLAQYQASWEKAREDYLRRTRQST